MTAFCFFAHRWCEWTSEVLECPDEDEIAVIEVWTRTCRGCGFEEWDEEVLAGARHYYGMPGTP